MQLGMGDLWRYHESNIIQQSPSQQEMASARRPKSRLIESLEVLSFFEVKRTWKGTDKSANLGMGGWRGFSDSIERLKF